MRMKTTIAAAAAALLGLAATAAAQEQRTSGPPVIRVQGTGEVRAAPDQAVADFAVETAAATAQQAAAENAQRMERVIAALVRAGVPRERIETRGYSVFPDYDPRPVESGEMRVRGYRVTNTVSATILDVARVGAVIDAALGAGSNRIHGVRFSVRDPQPFRARAIEEAARRARADAEALAAAMGVRLGMVREAATLDAGGGPPVIMERMEMADVAMRAPTPISPAEQVIRATVVVTYSITFM